MKWRHAKKISPWTSIFLSAESEYTDWRGKVEQSKGQSCDGSWESLVYGCQDEKYRRATFDIIPCAVVTSLETDAFMAIVACIDMMVRGNPARGREEGTQGSVAILRRQTSKVVYPKILIQGILFNGKLKNRDWTLRRDTPEILRMHLVQSWIFEKKVIWGPYSKKKKKGEPRERNPCALDFVDQPPKETSLREDFF